MTHHQEFVWQVSCTGFALLCLLGALVLDVLRTIARRKDDAVDPPDVAPATMPRDWLARLNGVSDERYTPAELEGIRRYKSAEPMGFSTSVKDDLTYGYGQLDDNGFWEFPVPYDALNEEHRDIVMSFYHDEPAAIMSRHVLH